MKGVRWGQDPPRGWELASFSDGCATFRVTYEITADWSDEKRANEYVKSLRPKPEGMEFFPTLEEAVLSTQQALVPAQVVWEFDSPAYPYCVMWDDQ